ncbi:MAG: LysR family transcriptional regulator [Oribacterium parvum]|jgi:transcriptional regulator, LysR family|uniref:LysR family transcriptional regulator n=1 Tax=Oribacterium parvum TaxID=1501329 RepID=UPI001CB0AC9C|nr:LysR family transcriptional regulator [Oribacterium parvum]MBF1268493.1 LysR family transcriptional regulator [Oribacterium parvum]
MEQNLSTYRIFFEVAKQGNISKAAESLYISQPAISKTIVRLEDNLNVKLFKRNSRGVSLTEEGEVLFRHVQEAIHHIEEAENALQKMKDYHIGHLDIGASTTLCRYILLPYLKKFMEEFPNIQINLKNQDSAKNIQVLEAQDIDIALVAIPKHLSPNQKVILEQEVEDIFVASPKYIENLKALHGNNFSLFQNATVMLMDDKNVSRHYIDMYIRENQLDFKQVIALNTMDLLIDFAKIDMGISCVIRSFVEKDLENGSLVQIDIAPPIPRRKIGFMYHANNCSKSLESFLSFLEKEKD